MFVFNLIEPSVTATAASFMRRETTANVLRLTNVNSRSFPLARAASVALLTWDHSAPLFLSCKTATLFVWCGEQFKRRDARILTPSKASAPSLFEPPHTKK